MRNSRLTRALRKASVAARYAGTGGPISPEARGVTCLLYHRIADRSDRPYLEDGGVPVTPPDVFRRQLRLLKAEGASFIGLADVLTGKGAAGPRVLITFDDGFHDNFTTALGILREERVPALFFVVSSVPGQSRLLWEHSLCKALADPSARARLLEAVSDRVGRRVLSEELGRTVRCRLPVAVCDEVLSEALGGRAEEEDADLYPTWDEVRGAVREGHAIGSHGRTHRMRHVLSAREFTLEAEGSRKELSERLGEDVVAFSYPFNSYLFGDEELCRAAGYRFVATVDPGRFDPAGSALRVPRLTVHRLHDSTPEFRRLVAEARD